MFCPQCHSLINFGQKTCNICGYIKKDLTLEIDGSKTSFITKTNKEQWINAIMIDPSEDKENYIIEPIFGTNIRAGLEVTDNVIYGTNGIANMKEYKDYAKVIIFFPFNIKNMKIKFRKRTF